MKQIVPVVITGVILFLGLATFNGCAPVVEEEDDRLHRRFMYDHIIMLLRHLDDRAVENYRVLGTALADSVMTRAQYDSVLVFKRRLNDYRNLLNVIRYEFISRSEGITLNEADTLSPMLIRNLDYICILSADTLNLLKNTSGQLINWVDEVPFCDPSLVSKLELSDVWDYGHTGRFIGWTDAGVNGIKLNQLVMTLYLLRLRSMEAEAAALNQVKYAMYSR